MSQNSIKIKKISKAMLMFVRVMTLVLVTLAVYFTVKSFSINYDNGLFREFTALFVSSMDALLIIAILAVVSNLLKSIEKDYSPFNISNVKKLKVLSGLLLAFEPVHLISTKVVQSIRPLILEGGTRVTSFISFGGVFFAVGLVVFCIALIFEYGIELQKQSDETL
ncbi:DUF2975 domain-containing protein [Clostridium tunisiense]|uniref:DUF2975 domain-containing protein n=1 Tax=Clostridium tunisiense TaxID=219748 RepID=UPI00031CFC4E|nr:DUF2975 domain-containing protein [Clostridium tunisiense]